MTEFITSRIGTEAQNVDLPDIRRKNHSFFEGSFDAMKVISYLLRSGKELFDDSGDKLSLDTTIFIHSWHLPKPAILIFRNSIGGHVHDWRKV